jgi:hypothetical protein
LTNAPDPTHSFDDAAKRVLAKLFGMPDRSSVAENAWIAASLGSSESAGGALSVIARLAVSRRRAIEAIAGSKQVPVIIDDAVSALNHAVNSVTSEMEQRGRSRQL